MSPGAQTTLPARLTQREVKDVYQSVALIYDVWGWLTETKARAQCLEWAAIRDGEAVLEVAVGTGLAFAEVLARNPSGRNEGIDLTPAMLARAQRRALATGIQNYRLNAGDAYALEYADSTFDVVINNFMFDLLPEQDFARVLAEYKRVLHPGGRLVLVNMARSERWYQRLWEVLYQINPAWIGGCRGVALLAPMQALGFTHTRRKSLSQMTFPAEIVYGIKAAE